MRVDMAKVIVERPRWGSRLASKKPGYRRSLHERPALCAVRNDLPSRGVGHPLGPPRSERARCAERSKPPHQVARLP
jgi:hypothetical protein